MKNTRSKDGSQDGLFWLRVRLTSSQENIIRGALKWIRRIRDRRDELPSSFLDGCDPSALVKELEAMLSPNAPRSATPEDKR